MPTTKIRGDSQIMDLTIDLGRLQVPFLSQTTGNWDITDGNPDFTNGATITNVPDPVLDQDVATKHYVDQLVQGVAWKDPVRVSNTGPVNISNEVEAGDTIDGVTLVAGDRVLLKDQTNAANDEVQTIQITGSPTGGDFDLILYPSGHDPVTVADLAYNVGAAAAETAIDAAMTAAGVTGWTNGDITVTGTDILNGLTLTYNDGSAGSGSLAAKNHGEATLVLDDLTGGTPVASIATTQEGNAEGSENGVYIVQATGAPVRADDWPEGDDTANYAVFVSEGDTNQDRAYVVVNDAPDDIIGSDELDFVQFAGPGTTATDVFNDVATGITHNNPTANLGNTNIVSNTERVYLNGVRQIRGASDDYQINYATGVITFNFNLKSNPGQQDIVVADYQL